MTYQTVIAEFRARDGAGAWNLPRSRVADDLLAILGNADAVDQGRFGFCGIAASLRFWIRRDAEAVARFAVALYDDGAATLGTWRIEPRAALRQRDYLADIAGGDTRCAPGEWMVLGAVQDAISPLGFEGTVSASWEAFLDLHEGAQPAQIASILGHTGSYAAVDDDVPWRRIFVPHLAFLRRFWRPGLKGATQLQPDADDIVILINDALIKGSAVPDRFADRISESLPNHYVALVSSVTTEGGRVRARVWTWAAEQDIDVPAALFEQNYYGAVVARRSHAG